MPIALLSTVSIVLISVLIPLLVIVLIVASILLLKRRFFSQANHMRKDYDYYHTLLTSDCKVMITRLGVLGKSSLEYQAMFEDRSKQFDEIMKKRDKEVVAVLDSLNSLLSEKKYKDAKEVLKQCQASLQAFIKAVSSFNEELSNLLREDSDTRELSVVTKEKFRKIKTFYENNKSDLQPLSKSFALIFKNTEDTFSKFEDLNNEAKFKEAKELLPKTVAILDAISAIMDELPQLVTRANQVIPEKLNKLETTYNEMTAQDYVLDYLNIPEELQEMRATLAIVNKKLEVLDIADIKDTLDKMQAHINDLNSKFEEEKTAKIEFKSLQSQFSDSTFELEKKYSLLINELPGYQKTYALDKKYVDQMIALKQDIENIGFLKRELDSYLNNSSKRPYTIITQRIHEMQQEISKVKRTINDYSDYLLSLKNTSQSIFTNIRTYFYKLKEAEFKVRQIGVSSYQSITKPKFDKLYATLAQINNIIITTPVEVSESEALFKDFKDEADMLLLEVNKQQAEAIKAEASIVYANEYRVDYTDSRQLLDTAQAAFSEGDFTRAQSAAVQVVTQFGQADETAPATDK